MRVSFGSLPLHVYYQRKFRSQTSDNIERRKAEKRREEKKRETERVRRKKIEAREMLGKSRHILFSNDLWVGRVEK